MMVVSHRHSQYVLDHTFAGNYTACAIQSSGLHFFTSAPQPSGQQYTGLHIAAEATKLIPAAHINNKTEVGKALPFPCALTAGLRLLIQCLSLRSVLRVA